MAQEPLLLGLIKLSRSLWSATASRILTAFLLTPKKLTLLYERPITESQSRKNIYGLEGAHGAPVHLPRVCDFETTQYLVCQRKVLRVLRSGGLRLQDTPVEDSKCLFKLSALALGAATRIVPLANAHDGSSRSVSDEIATDLIEPVAATGKTLEGKTDRQENPYDKGQLAWLSWIVAHLGVWNCDHKSPDRRQWRIAGSG